MTLPDWLEPLPDAAAQRELDRWAIEERGIPGLELMERAGAGLAELVVARCPAGRIAVVCGKGNNGGDGFVAARLLHAAGREVDVVMLAEPDELSGDARANFERLPEPAAGAPGTLDSAGSPLHGAAAIIDAILGTGFSGTAHGSAAEAIAAINAAGVGEIVACDVPSGVDASTGEVHGPAVRATATATFHAAKPGLWVAPGKGHAGEVTVIDIGIPAGGPVQAAAGLIGPAVAAAVPRRSSGSTKFAAGRVLVCGGSTGLTGAPCLSAQAAMRAGAGYVTACVPASLNPIFEGRLLEAMTVPLEDVDGALQVRADDVLLERAARADSLVLGPGLGRAQASLKLARNVARRSRLPMVLDADGLNAHAGRLEDLAARTDPTVLTPHAGELARLLGVESDAVGARRLASARQAAAGSRSVVVLKGDDTIVATPDGRAAISRGDAPALATAGTGDVLAGMLGAYLAKGMDEFEAACAAVLVHVGAGRLAAEWVGAEGVIARDVIEALPAAFGAALEAATEES
jgi:NAD(P)H-hydrate epimerase